MKHRGRVDENGAVELPDHRRRGTYPPDIARRRRQLRLPVTPEEHAAYARGEYPEPPATRAQIQATLREWAPRCSPVLRKVLEEIADRQVAMREPGSDDDDPT